jgi:hypothetical protein
MVMIMAAIVGTLAAMHPLAASLIRLLAEWTRSFALSRH